MRILKRIREEIRLNDDEIVCFGMSLEKRAKPNETHVDLMRKKLMGPFNEQRGFQHNVKCYTGPFYHRGVTKDEKPNKYWHEAGSWLYNRACNQWECISVPGGWVTTDRITYPEIPQFYCNYYGDSLENSYVCHYWGGTAGHNYKLMVTGANWFGKCQEWLLRREEDLWKKYVPEFIRKESLAKGLIEDFDTELSYALSRRTA